MFTDFLCTDPCNGPTMGMRSLQKTGVSGDASFDFQAFSAYDKYVLTNDDQVTWEQLFQSEISSLSDACIPHEEVYCEYTWKIEE